MDRRGAGLLHAYRGEGERGVKRLRQTERGLPSSSRSVMMRMVILSLGV